MIAATHAVQRPNDAKLLIVDEGGRIQHASRDRFVDVLRRGDLVIANDAATLPASLRGEHLATWREVEVRLAGRCSLLPHDIQRFSAVVFGAGDYHTPTEKRPLPPELSAGDRLALGPLRATVTATLGHPRLVSIRFDGSPDQIWAGLARHGHPIQYAHMNAPLALWDVWTVIAGPPVAFEPPSAGFVLDWQTLIAMRAKGVQFATITHAAGISSTGDDDLDARLPFDEPYEIPIRTAQLIERTRAGGGRIVAIGTTVVRALEHAASMSGGLRSGPGMATQRITEASALRIVDAVLSGVHEPTTSHYRLLRAFAELETLRKADAELESRGYRTHEFGDSVWFERQRPEPNDVSDRLPPIARCDIVCAKRVFGSVSGCYHREGRTLGEGAHLPASST